MSPVFLLLILVCSFWTQTCPSKVSRKCLLAWRTLSVKIHPVPWIVLSNANNYSSAPNICDRFEPTSQDCCAIDPAHIAVGNDHLELEQLRVEWLGPLATTLLNHAIYLQNYFVECLNLTLTALDVSFQSSYGYNYQHNKEFFVQFFGNLESYMLGHRQNISEMVDDFFNELLKRIVRLLLFAKSRQDLVVADCISSQLQRRNPFDRIPEGIKRMAIRAFPPARITANALFIGSEVISSLLKEVYLTNSCHINWMKLRYCNFCFGEAESFICEDTCRKKMALCMTDYYSLDEPWTQFIDHLLELIDRLRGSDSFPQVNRPLQIHITDAIMSFQRLFSRINPVLLKNCSRQEKNPTAIRLRPKRHLFPSSGPGVFSSIPETVDYFRSLPSLENQTKLMQVEVSLWVQLISRLLPFVLYHRGVTFLVTQYLSARSLFANLDRWFCSPHLLRYSKIPRKSTRMCWNGKRMSSARYMIRGKISNSGDEVGFLVDDDPFIF
ncbi:Glypican-4 [Fasciola gigantica]|uniref:Glypican-4 n=1 Tax=Fasciola gigantica TaxID=46835 RepID=A0A504YPA4_FASGI|nr:Glypican-4 [Fasciola gigantica]